ncbi:MAG: proprotein convertase P-domain-containing protein [Phycisphaerae bacterium]
MGATWDSARIGLGIGALLFSAVAFAEAAGPDVIVVDLQSTIQYDSFGDTAGLAVGTTSCNIGDAVLQWQSQPSNQHPVIAQNMYRLMNDRLEQIGQAWVKHGFLAIDTGLCGVCDGNVGSVLGVGCSDPYETNLNRGPFLGARVEINPVTGFFDGATTNDHTGHAHSPIAHGLQVKHADLGNPGARYFVEGQYVTADDALAGNGNNNASYREVGVSGDSNGWTFTNLDVTQQQTAAVFAWPGAAFTILDAWPVEGRLILACKTTDLGGGQFHYEYAIYNMNSDRGVQSFTVPLGAASASNIGFHAAPVHDEGYPEDPSNTPWTWFVDSGALTWTTDAFTVDPNANAVRWGTLSNFWFDADAPPVSSAASLRRFKPGAGGNVVLAQTSAPTPADCNANGVPDADELAADPSLDCNGDGFLDACQLDGSDCDGNGVLDECEIAGEDCNANGVLDRCELAGNDCNANGVPDECDSPVDCNANGIPDVCDALAGPDCNGNGTPDECENDCDLDGTIDACSGEPDCNVNGLPDSCDLTGAPGGAFSYPSGLLFTTFGPNNIAPQLEATDGGILTDVNVFVDIKHTWVADIDMTLVHNGTSVVLWDQACGSLDDILVTFDDAGSPLSCASPTTGTFTPASAGGGTLSDFDGADPLGTWTLEIRDNFPGQDNGFIRSWTLEITAAPRPAFSQDTDSNGIPDECECPTLPGDLDGDGIVDGRDVSSFVSAFLTGFDVCADMDTGGPPLDDADLQSFVAALLGA